MRSKEILSVAHQRGKTENAGQFRGRLFHTAKTDFECGAVGNRSDPHYPATEFTGGAPRYGRRIFKSNLEVFAWTVIAVTPKTQALCREINGHGLFKPRDHFRADANWNSQCPSRTSTTFGFPSKDVSVGCGAGLLFEMNGDSESWRCIGKSKSARELVHLRGAFQFQCIFRLDLRARVPGPNDFQDLIAADDSGRNLRLTIGQRSVMRKSDPQCYTQGVGLLGGDKQAATRDVNRFF